MRHFVTVAFCAVLFLGLGGVLPAALGQPENPPLPKARALIIVDESVYPQIKSGLAKYIEHVLRDFRVVCTPLVDDYYDMKPAEIRAILKKAYDESRSAKYPVPVVGAIMVGPIPHALRTHDPEVILIPSPLYYEDFEAEWIDENGDGFFEEIKTDRKSNPTEIWTAWWVPPAMEHEKQVEHLKAYLEKLDKYHRGELSGRDQMLWAVGNVTQVETIEGWTVLLKDSMKPLEQELKIWCRAGQDTGTFRPNKRKEEFGPKDFMTAFTLQPWQHVHVIVHGNQRGFYWDNTGVVVARGVKGKPEWSLLMNLDQFEGTAANIITSAGCSNGNFRGAYVGPAYDRAIANNLLFSPHTITVAFYGAASPQSTSGFASYCTELIESLAPEGDSYFAEGYYKMRNHDYSWGTQHYFFRGGDEKILNGDPFVRYRWSQPFPEEKQKEIQETIEKAKWEETGPW